MTEKHTGNDLQSTREQDTGQRDGHRVKWNTVCGPDRVVWEKVFRFPDCSFFFILQPFAKVLLIVIRIFLHQTTLHNPFWQENLWLQQTELSNWHKHSGPLKHLEFSSLASNFSGLSLKYFYTLIGVTNEAWIRLSTIGPRTTWLSLRGLAKRRGRISPKLEC